MSKKQEPIINGIDVSEEIRYCNNCSNLGLDFKVRKFYCSLSHRPDELPEVLSCDEFNTNCYIKRLQEENKRLQMLSCANCGEKYLSPEGAELYDKMLDYKDALEEIKNYLNTLSNIDGDFVNTETYLRIQDMINEVFSNE